MSPLDLYIDTIPLVYFLETPISTKQGYAGLVYSLVLVSELHFPKVIHTSSNSELGDFAEYAILALPKHLKYHLKAANPVPPPFSYAAMLAYLAGYSSCRTLG